MTGRGSGAEGYCPGRREVSCVLTRGQAKRRAVGLVDLELLWAVHTLQRLEAVQRHLAGACAADAGERRAVRRVRQAWGTGAAALLPPEAASFTPRDQLQPQPSSQPGARHPCASVGYLVP
jgi:hypothetical protein